MVNNNRNVIIEDINFDEALRYMGYGNQIPDDTTKELLLLCAKQLKEAMEAGHLGLDDFLAVSGGVCERLLGEYRLASLDSCQNRTLVELTRGGNYNSAGCIW